MSERRTAADLEKAFEDLRRYGEQQEKELRWLRPIGFVTRLLVYAVLFGALFLFQPENIFDKPLAMLTLGSILNSVLWIGAIFLLGYWLFHPSGDPDTQGAWGGLGTLLIIGALGWAVYQFGLINELKLFIANTVRQLGL